MFETVVKNVRLMDQEGLFSIGMNDGKFAEITRKEINGTKEWDGDGGLAFPPFVEMHTHLDTVLTSGTPRFNQSGTLKEGIEIWQERKELLSVEELTNRSETALRMLVKHGVQHVRAAVDISDSQLTALRVLLGVREKFRDLLDLQIIAFPQDGLVSCPGNQRRLIQAVELGADAVSAVPHLERTREQGIASLEYCFDVAKRHGVKVHIFTDEVDDEHSRFLEVIADLTIKENMQGAVTASHAIALSYYSDAYAAKVISLIKQAELTIVACPLINSAMQGRFDHHPKGRGITRIKELHAAEVNVCIAHDDIRTPFYPFGNGNMLQVIHMTAHLAHMTGSEEVRQLFQMVMINGAKAFGLTSNYGIEVDKSANLIIFPDKEIPDLISRQPECQYVFRNGQLIVETIPAETRWHEG